MNLNLQKPQHVKYSFTNDITLVVPHLFICLHEKQQQFIVVMKIFEILLIIE